MVVAGARLILWARLAEGGATMAASVKDDDKSETAKPDSAKPAPETQGEGHEELRKAIKKARAELARLQGVDVEMDEIEARDEALAGRIKDAKHKGRDITTVAMTLAPLFAHHADVRAARLRVSRRAIKGKVSVTNKKALAAIAEAGLELQPHKRGRDKLADMKVSLRLPKR